MEDLKERTSDTTETDTTGTSSDAGGIQKASKVKWLKNRWKRFSLWWRKIRIRTTSFLSYKFGGFFIGMGLGVLGGLAIRLPLLPKELFSEKLLSAVQSVAGAMVGAGLAGLLARMLIARTDVQTRQMVAKVIRAPASMFSEMLDCLGAPTAPNLAQAKKSVEKLEQAAKDGVARLKLLSTSHAQITEGRGVAIVDAQIALEEFLEERHPGIEEILERASKNKVGEFATVSYSSSVRSQPYDWSARLKEKISPTLTSLDDALLELGLPRRNFISFYSDD